MVNWSKDPVKHPVIFNLPLFQLANINQTHYQDIVEERAITNLCGYPLCKEEIGE